MAQVPPRVDFSGTWVFDEAASSRHEPNGHVVIAKLLGDEVTIQQDERTLRLAISMAGAHVDVSYTLDGSESRNTSPDPAGDVVVTSKAVWQDGKLVIRSSSPSTVNGQPVLTETTRVMWLDADGALILDRSGTPATEVPTTRSVYRRKR